MRRLATVIALLGCLFAAKRSEAQTPQITQTLFVDSCYSFTNTILISASQATVLNSKIEFTYGDGQMDTVQLSAGNFNVSIPPNWVFGFGTVDYHHYAAPGTYTLKAVLLYNGSRVDSVTTSVTSACQYITGQLYHDVNANCQYDAGIDGQLLQSASIQVDSAGVHVDTIQAYGYWSYRITGGSGTVYTFRLLNPLPAGFTPTCPTSGVLTYTYLPGTTLPSQNFGFSCSSTSGLDLSLTRNRTLRAATSGGQSQITLWANAISCQPTAATVTLQVSPKYSINTAGIYPAPASVSGQTVTWNATVSNTTHNNAFHVPLTPNAGTSIGDTACNYAIITPTAGDINPANNVIAVCDSVIGSWDPNDKTVVPAGAIHAGTKLTYTIQFENLGTDTAFNVHIMDTLSANVDAASMQLISSTHAVRTFVYTAGGKNILKFDFPNIRLADKNHPLTNKGAVTFSINAKAGLTSGAEILNTAGIFFDGNPPVITNTARNYIGIPAGVSTLGRSGGIEAYPSPAGAVLTIRVQDAGYSNAVLMNSQGQVVLQQQLTLGQNSLNIAALPAGIYYLQASGKAGTVTQKISKQ